MICIGGTQVEVYMKVYYGENINIFQNDIIHVYTDCSILENFVSEEKILGKVLQSIIAIIYLIGPISMAHWRLFLWVLHVISFHPHFLLYQIIFYSTDNLDNFSTLESLSMYWNLSKNYSQGR